MKRLFTCLVLMISLALVPGLVLSQVTQTACEWSPSTLNQRPTGATAVAFLNENDCDGMVVNAVYGTVNLRLASTGAIWGTYSTTGSYGGPIDNTPVLVKLKDGKWYVFVTSEDGRLYKVDVANHGAIAATGGISQIADLRRPAESLCTVHDKITAAPVVQLLAESNSDYTLGKDIVMVATHHGCGSTTTNMVYAFDAADVTKPPIWIFNEFGDYAVDYCDNFILDIDRNAIFTVHNRPSASIQNTVWRLNTVTGDVVWGSDFFRILSRPVLGNAGGGGFDHLYVADMLGHFHAINPDNGIEDWNLDLAVAPGVYVELPLTIGDGDFAQVIMATSSGGIVHAIYDGGTGPADGEVLWTYQHASGVKAITSCVIMSDTVICYVGFDDGTVHELNTVTGADGVYFMPYNSVLPAGSDYCAELAIYSEGLLHKLIQSHWDGSNGVICKNNVPGFIYNANPPNQSLWVGSISSAWENAGNWAPNGVPDATKDVLINPCFGVQFENHNIVTISSNAVCRTINIRPHAIVTVTPGFKLNVVH